MASDGPDLSDRQKALILDIERQFVNYPRSQMRIDISPDDGFPTTQDVLEIGICLISRGLNVRPCKEGILIEAPGYRGRN